MPFSLPRPREILAVVPALLVFAISIAEISLQEELLDFYHNWYPSSLQLLPARFQTASDNGDNAKIMYQLPMDLRKTGNTLAIAAGGLGIATAAIWLLAFWVQLLSQSEKNKPYRRWSILVCILAGSSILYTLATFIYVFYMEYSSSSFHYTDNLGLNLDSEHLGDVPPGSYTRESWACQMHQFHGKDSNYNGSLWGDGCRKAMAARWVLLPLLVAMLAFGVVTAIDCKAAIQKSHEKPGPAEKQEELPSYNDACGA